MPMMLSTFRFPAKPSESELRRLLHAELGRSKARDVEIDVHVGSGGNEYSNDVSLLSMDVVGMIYAEKICRAFGGTKIWLGLPAPCRPTPEWAKTPWTAHGFLMRLRIRLGPKRI